MTEFHQDARPHSVHVTLVHGTNATDGDWFRDGSFFRTQLVKTLNTRLFFHDLLWDGGNSHDSRLSAAEDLVTHVQGIHVRNPRSSQYVICHSHAGNIALYAAKNKEFQQAVHGIMTMGTPFISCTANKFVTVFADKQYYLAVALSVALSPLILIFVISLIELQPPALVSYVFGEWAQFMFATPLMLIGACLLVLAVQRLENSFLSVGKSIRERQAQAVATLNVGSWPGEKLFIARVTFDEAGWWLRALAHLTSVPHRFSRGLDVLLMLAHFPRTWLGLLTSTIIVFFLDPIGVRHVEDFEGRTPVLVISSMVIAYMVAVAAEFAGAAVAAVLFTTSLLIPPFAAVIRSHQLGFGAERILQAASVDISTSQFPVVLDHRTTVYNASSRRFLGFRGGFRHSEFYESSDVVNAIAAWIETREQSL